MNQISYDPLSALDAAAKIIQFTAIIIGIGAGFLLGFGFINRKKYETLIEFWSHASPIIEAIHEFSQSVLPDVKNNAAIQALTDDARKDLFLSLRRLSSDSLEVVLKKHSQNANRAYDLIKIILPENFVIECDKLSKFVRLARATVVLAEQEVSLGGTGANSLSSLADPIKCYRETMQRLFREELNKWRYRLMK